MKINRLDGYEFVGLTGNRRRFLAAKFWPANHQAQCWQSRTCICCHNWGSTCKGCRRTSQEPGTPRCTAQPPPPMSRTLLKHVMMFFLSKTHDRDFPLRKVPSGQPSGRSVVPPSAPRAPCPKPCWHLDHLKRMKRTNRLSMKEQPTGLTDPDQRNKCCLGSVASPPSQHLGQLPEVFGKSWPKRSNGTCWC